MSEAWAEIGPAVAYRSAADEAAVSAQAERKAALKARPDRRDEPVPVSVNLVEWMSTGFFTCSLCLKHWQWVAPTGHLERGPDEIGRDDLPECPFCGASRWKVKWQAPAF